MKSDFTLGAQIEALDWVVKNWSAIARATKFQISSAEYQLQRVKAARQTLINMERQGS